MAHMEFLLLLTFTALCAASTGPWEGHGFGGNNWGLVPHHENFEHGFGGGHDREYEGGFDGRHGNGYRKTISNGHRSDWGDYNYGGHGDYLKASAYGEGAGRSGGHADKAAFENSLDKGWDNGRSLGHYFNGLGHGYHGGPWW